MDVIRDRTQATDVAEVGGKAASLAWLAQAGFAPPPFVALTPDAFAGDDAQPQPGLAEALAEHLARIGPGPYAVRSSGRAEDGAQHSHAGQFDSLLNVPTEGVIEAARRVWLSGFGDRVATYRAETTGAPPEAPAIVIQQMIQPRASGVAFSADPVTGLRGQVVISAVAGLGDQLVSGTVDGEDWTLTPQGHLTGAAKVLSAEDARAIAALVRRAEDSFGRPQDIEWALDAAGLHILQSRPITTPLRPAPQADTALTVFDNSNVVESYPGLVSPLTYGFAQHVYARVYRAFVRLLGVSEPTVATQRGLFDNMLGRVDGRVYYNLGNWYRALALLPGFSLNRGFMEVMMGVAEPLPEELTATIGPPPATGAERRREYMRLARVGVGLVWQAIRLPRTKRNFYARLNAALQSGLDLDRANATDLAQEYRQIESTLLDRWDAPLVNDFLCMIAFGASRKLLEAWLGDKGLALHNDVMIGQGDIVSAEPAQMIAAMGARAREVGLAEALATGETDVLSRDADLSAMAQAYLDKFGDRCTEELKLESIPLAQDPTPLVLAVAAAAARPAAAHPVPPVPQWRRLLPNPLKRWVARAFVGWAKARVRDRENLRFERTRIFGHARRLFLAMGRELTALGHLDDARDVLFLTPAEVLGAVEGYGLSPNLRGLVALRRAEDAASAERPDPPERVTMRGPALVPQWAAPAAPVSQDRMQVGTGCSAGEITAPARVIRDPRRQSLSAGEILVARHTDPGWIAVFANASAIVVERGSLLSHSAIVAREMGIPCVVGLKGVTDWVTDSEPLRVNGTTGEVERIDG